MENDRKILDYRRLDAFIVRFFPMIIVYCLALVLLFLYYSSSSAPYDIMYNICLGFALGFVTFGIVCLAYVGKPVIKSRYVMPFLLLAPIILSTCLVYCYGLDFTPNIFISQFYLFAIDGEVTFWTVIIGMYIIELTIISVAAAVSSVISAYFRTYFSRLLLGPMDKKPNSKIKKIADWLFVIPDIIDVEDVVLEPEEDNGRFNTSVFKQIFVDMFVMGLAICSFLFLSPYFVNEMPIEKMLMTAVLLSLFISALVVPWHIIKSVGAKAKSQAPRDFYFWRGMKGRLTSSVIVISFFVLLFLMLTYLRMDLAKVFIIYASYFLFMGVISSMYSFVYVNSFYYRFKKGQIESFNKEKEKMLARQENTPSKPL
ncbi:MAG TPA: hypothetical protein VJY42_04355 [Candidatus Methanomethylophilaceae archaeon]|nr:hypothetical protein [Candidatus Methanomethylophilaceae archaeon]